MRELRIMKTALVDRARDSNKRKRFGGWRARFAADRSGNVAMMFGFLAIPVFLSIGGAARLRARPASASGRENRAYAYGAGSWVDRFVSWLPFDRKTLRSAPIYVKASTAPIADRRPAEARIIS